MHYYSYRNEYPIIIYKDFKIIKEKESIKVEYTYVLGKYTFTPSITISNNHITNQNIDEETLSYLFFNYGLVDIINYYKLTCPKEIIIEAGFIDNDQILFFKKLIYNGLSEYFYRNNINLSFEEFTKFTVASNKKFKVKKEIDTTGSLVLVGGGKDSIVSLELLKEEKDNNLCFLFERNIYPKNIPSYNTITTYGYDNSQIVTFKADIDPLLLQLNKEGFLNGHIPFSSQLAFASYIMAYLNNKKYIVVSNEASSNEVYVKNTNINHQYSKSFEFENDFRNYTSKYFTDNIEYFSLLRPLLEIQIAKIFSHYPKYFEVFRSCNLSSKEENKRWCGKCPKCLFIYIILSPYIEEETLETIFNKNLLNDKDLLSTFKDLIGVTDSKPFECVGTIDEVNYACSKTIKKYLSKGISLPYLLDYYNNNYPLSILDLDFYWNDNNNVPPLLIERIRKELNINDK